MSIRLDAERLLNQLTQAETAIERLGQNWAYREHSETSETLYERVGQTIAVVKPLVSEIELLELRDPTHSLYPGEWRTLGFQVVATQRRVKKEVEEPLAQLLEEVGGAAAKARWVSARPVPPVLEVRDRWAMLVGVSDYRNAGLLSLSTTSSDARAIHALLLSDQRYGYEAAKTRMFIDSASRRDDILGAIKSCAQAAGREDMLFFYFSGHGDLKDGDAILIPYDYNRAAPRDSAILIAEVTELMESSHARAKIIILDACHSGPDIPLGDEEKKSVEAEMGMSEGFVERVFEQASGTAILSSSVASQVSWTYREKGLSAFTYFLREGLRGGADFDRKGFVTVSDVFHYVANGVREWGEKRGAKQTPALSYTTTGEIILMDYRQGKAT